MLDEKLSLVCGDLDFAVCEIYSEIKLCSNVFVQLDERSRLSCSGRIWQIGKVVGGATNAKNGRIGAEGDEIVDEFAVDRIRPGRRVSHHLLGLAPIM